MTQRILSSTILAIALLAALPASAGGDANLFLGQKSLADNNLDSAGVDGQSQWGVAVTLDFEWPVALALDLLSSSDSKNSVVMASGPLEFDTSADTLELDVGVRKLWNEKRLQPYVGGGLALVELDVKQTMSGSLGGGSSFSTLVVDDSGSGVGFWANAGLIYRVGRSINVGVDVRFSDTDVDLASRLDPDQVKLDSGGTHYGFVVGYHW